MPIYLRLILSSFRCMVIVYTIYVRNLSGYLIFHSTFVVLWSFSSNYEIIKSS